MTASPEPVWRWHLFVRRRDESPICGVRFGVYDSQREAMAAGHVYKQEHADMAILVTAMADPTLAEPETPKAPVSHAWVGRSQRERFRAVREAE